MINNVGDVFNTYRYLDPTVMLFSHIHPQYEFYFCTDRVEQMSVINGVEYRYNHPAVILSAPYTIHSMSCVDAAATSCEIFVFYFSNKTSDAFDERFLPQTTFEDNMGLFYELTDDEADELRKIAELCHSLENTAEKELAFMLFVNRLSSLCPPERVKRVGTSSFYIRDVLRYIAENMEDEINITDISAKFAVSRSKLDRDFKKFTGITAHNYIDICRINHAKYLLSRKNSMSVSEIASRCGFKNDSCFFHFFKRVTGKHPSDFRRK